MQELIDKKIAELSVALRQTIAHAHKIAGAIQGLEGLKKDLQAPVAEQKEEVNGGQED
jgi:hypothetical protein